MAMYQQWSFGIAPNQDKSLLTLMYLTKPGFVAKPCITVSQTHFDTTFIYTNCYMNYNLNVLFQANAPLHTTEHRRPGVLKVCEQGTIVPAHIVILSACLVMPIRT